AAAVVDDHVLPVVVGLREDALDTLGKVGGAVVNGRDDGDERRGHETQLAPTQTRLSSSVCQIEPAADAPGRRPFLRGSTTPHSLVAGSRSHPDNRGARATRNGGLGHCPSCLDHDTDSSSWRAALRSSATSSGSARACSWSAPIACDCTRLPPSMTS